MPARQYITTSGQRRLLAYQQGIITEEQEAVVVKCLADIQFKHDRTFFVPRFSR